MRTRSNGKVIVNVIGAGRGYRWETEIDDYSGKGAEAVAEGVGWDYFFDYVDFPGTGRYLIEDIEVTYYPGDCYNDADEDIDFGKITLVSEDYVL